MGIVTIDGHLLKNMIIAGANKLAADKEYIDSLNVFPVPDGDTGTNMSLTALAAAKEVQELDTPDIYEVAKAASNGSLRGARGNSGVILSQLFRGFAKGLEGHEAVDIDGIASAFVKASETAYKAVMKPKEGTILTVAREMADKAVAVTFDCDEFEEFMIEVLKFGGEVLKKTTDMLPVLKQAGVVDAGGQGLLTLLAGAFDSIYSGTADILVKDFPGRLEGGVDFSALSTVSHEEITFTYCTEFFINVKKATDKIERDLQEYLSKIGDSIVVVGDEDIIKIHVHTNNPGQVLEKAVTFGELSNLKIENMKIQHTNATGLSAGNTDETKKTFSPQEEAPRKDTGFVAVSAGNGFKELFESLGDVYCIEGGQTMNPSAEDIAEAVKKINAENVIILPNNKNIVLAAQQSKYLCEGVNTYVVPSKSIPQGIAALLSFMPDCGLPDNLAKMEEAMALVKTGQITYAVRDTVINDKEIKQGDYLCMVDGDIEVVSQSLDGGAKELLEHMITEDTGIVTIFYGLDIAEETAGELVDFVSENYPDCEVEVQYGAQPVYYYIFSVE